MRLARLNCRAKARRLQNQRIHVGLDLGQRGGDKTKNPPCQSARRSQKTSGKLCQLFSSFLRGASCPKSPRVKCSFDSVGATLAATAAKLFMPEGLADVKREICSGLYQPLEGIRARQCSHKHRGIGLLPSQARHCGNV